MNKGLLLAGAGALVAAVLLRKPKKKKTKKTSPDVSAIDSGTGYSTVLGINVRWAISRVSGAFIWEWVATSPVIAMQKGVPIADQSGPYETEEEANSILVEALGLEPMPRPEDDLGEGEPEPPNLPGPALPPGPNPIGPPPGMGMGTPKPPGPVAEPADQLFPLTLFPPGGDASKLPLLSNPAGMVFSEDCTVAAVGPMFWDDVGERVETLTSDGVKDEDAIMEVLAEDLFPMEEILTCSSAQLIYTEITGRVRDYLEG